MDLQALKELHAAVKAGKLNPQDYGRLPNELYVIGGFDDMRNAFSAYGGDLNAAHALHDALLPEWTYGLCSDAYNEKYAFVSDGDFETDEEYSECHARAWLLAILSALISQEEQR